MYVILCLYCCTCDCDYNKYSILIQPFWQRLLPHRYMFTSKFLTHILLYNVNCLTEILLWRDRTWQLFLSSTFVHYVYFLNTKSWHESLQSVSNTVVVLLSHLLMPYFHLTRPWHWVRGFNWNLDRQLNSSCLCFKSVIYFVRHATMQIFIAGKK